MRRCVDSLTVSNNEGSVSLSKVDGTWELPNGVPAAGFKVDSVLERFSNAAGSWPVANTRPTRERLEVTEENHQRHIVVGAGDDTVADIYLGTSPGYRKTHARRAGEDDVYAVRFSNYEAGVKPADWLDRSLLRPKGDVAALRRLPADPVSVEEQPDPATQADAAEEEEADEPVAGFEFSKNEEDMWTSSDGSETRPGQGRDLRRPVHGALGHRRERGGTAGGDNDGLCSHGRRGRSDPFGVRAGGRREVRRRLGSRGRCLRAVQVHRRADEQTVRRPASGPPGRRRVRNGSRA